MIVKHVLCDYFYTDIESLSFSCMYIFSVCYARRAHLFFCLFFLTISLFCVCVCVCLGRGDGSGCV